MFYTSQLLLISTVKNANENSTYDNYSQLQNLTKRNICRRHVMELSQWTIKSRTDIMVIKKVGTNAQ